MSTSQTIRSAIVSLLMRAVFLLIWHLWVEAQKGPAVDMDPEYAALMGESAKGGSAMTGPMEVGRSIFGHFADPFNDKGIGIQLGYSIARVMAGFGLAALVAVPLGFCIGMSPVFRRAFDPFIQILKPVSPLAWMPLALYTIKDSNLSSVFVIFICAIWPMLINTAFGVAGVRREWINVAKTLEVPNGRMAWLVIVVAEMLVGGTGIGYFVWNEWNNLSITGVISAIFFIGLVGMVLDLALARVARMVEYVE